MTNEQREWLRAKISIWQSEMLLMLNHPISYVKSWWHYYKHNRYMRRVARAMRRSCEEWGRLVGEMYLAGFAPDGRFEIV